MKDDEFTDRVHSRLGGSRDRAEQSVSATLLALGQQLAGQEAHDLGEQLPPRLASCLRQTADQGENLSVGEFYERIAELGDLDPDEAPEHAKAVLGVLQEAVTRGEMVNLFTRLPDEYENLLAEAGGR